MKKFILTVNICVLLLAGCKKDIPHISPENTLLTFQFITSNNTEQIANDLNCTISDTLVVGITGTNSSRATLVANFTTTGMGVSIDGVQQVSGVTINDFTNPVEYTVLAQDGSKKKYTVKLKSFTGIPIIYIITESPIVSKDDYVNGTMKIDGNFDFIDGLYDGNIQIKGRGNSTWYADKKPYKIKLEKKTGILGMKSDKEWALLANYYDKSLLRNDVAFELSEQLVEGWSPRRRFAEVFLNGQYNGNYLLTETVKVSNDRVDIDTKDGGYLIEFNSKPEDGDVRFYTGSGGNILPVDVKEGDIPVENIKSDVDSFYYKIEHYQFFDPITGYQNKFDLDAFVNWYLVNEIMLNNDAAFYSSVFLQKKNTASKLQMGPVWDFDLSSGNVNYGQISPEGWYLKTGNVVQFIWYDPDFQAAVKEKWNKNKTQIMSIIQYIDTKGKTLEMSANENFRRWDILNVALVTSVVIPGTYQGEVDYFKNWLDRRIRWMDAEINK